MSKKAKVSRSEDASTGGSGHSIQADFAALALKLAGEIWREKSWYSSEREVRERPAATALLDAPVEVQASAVVELFRRIGALRPEIDSEIDLLNVDKHSNYSSAAGVLLGLLYRRKLPLGMQDWEAVTTELARYEVTSIHGFVFLPSMTTALEAFAKAQPSLSDGLAAAVQQAALSLSPRADESRLQKRLLALVPHESPSSPGQTAAEASKPLEPPRSGPSTYQRLAACYWPAATAQGRHEPPQFLMPEDDPDVAIIRRVNELIALPGDSRYGADAVSLYDLPKDPRDAARLARGLFAALAVLSQNVVTPTFEHDATERYSDACHHAIESLALSLTSNVVFEPDDLIDLADSLRPLRELQYRLWPAGNLQRQLAQQVPGMALGPAHRDALKAIRERLLRVPHPYRPEIGGLNAAMGEHAPRPLDRGDRFADAVTASLASRQSMIEAWQDLLAHSAAAEGSKPTGKWLKRGAEVIDAVGRKAFHDWLASTLPAFGKPRESWGVVAGADSSIPLDGSANVVKGLVWLAAAFDDAAMSSLLGDVGMASFKMVSGHGARCVRTGNACVWALSQMTGMHPVVQLSRLRELVKFGSARNVLDKALQAAADKAGCPREELEEIALPAFDLDTQGTLRETLGEAMVEIKVDADGADWRWFNAQGKVLKSVPAAVKTAHAEDFKRLKQTLEDIRKLLPALRDRLERLMVCPRSWPIEAWRARYLDHPLMAPLARRLIWTIEEAGRRTAALWRDGALCGVDGRPIAEPSQQATVSIWHPIEATLNEVVAWRGAIVEHDICQPFKQAHREIYLLTDAERRTRIYSNRFAAHIIRVPQLTRLAQGRAWSGGTIGSYDPVDHEHPSLKLPAHNLRAEFWVEGTGTETTPAGIHLFGQTDQVRFYVPIDAREPTPLEAVPSRAFSEVMRDVDLFVGVGSIGNDPTWVDRGEADPYRGYWNSFAFGEISESARVRHDVLERLLPKLKIAPRCELAARFLGVRGDMRTYKIHLGSGNILMEPNDQYLCIVPDRLSAKEDGAIHLPFEGDTMLSIILSKAFLLADDLKIKDETILRQIKPQK